MCCCLALIGRAYFCQEVHTSQMDISNNSSVVTVSREREELQKAGSQSVQDWPSSEEEVAEQIHLNW